MSGTQGSLVLQLTHPFGQSEEHMRDGRTAHSSLLWFFFPGGVAAGCIRADIWEVG